MKIVIIDPCHEALESGLEEAGHELIDATTLSAKEIASQYPEATGMLVRARIALYTGILGRFSRSGLHCSFRVWNGTHRCEMGRRKRHTLSQCGRGQQAGGWGIRPGGAAQSVPQDPTSRSTGAARHLAAGGQPWGRTLRKDRGHHRLWTDGLAFSQLLKGFDLRVLVYDKYKSGFGHDWIEEVPLKLIQKRSDVLSIHLPLNDETRHYIDRGFIEKLEQRPYLINTSRGDRLVLKDLLWGLQEEKLRGACLDVLEVESKDFEDAHQQKENKAFWTLSSVGGMWCFLHISLAGPTKASKRWLMFF